MIRRILGHFSFSGGVFDASICVLHKHFNEISGIKFVKALSLLPQMNFLEIIAQIHWWYHSSGRLLSTFLKFNYQS